VVLKATVETDEKNYFFDKKTGEKFAKLSGLLINDINHYHLKSEASGKTILLSEYGIQRRFSETPDLETRRIRNIIPRFLNLI
jgi:hypothetical protein